MTLRDRLTQVAADLGVTPGEDVGWDRLLAYWNEGACLVAEQRPDLFTRAMQIKLRPGAIQEPDCCRSIGSVFGQCDDSGRVVKAIVLGAGMLSERWSAAPLACRPSKPFRLTSIRRSGQAKNQFVVNPPVPAHESVYMLVNCAIGAKHYTPDDFDQEVSDIDCGSAIALVQWIQYRFISSEESTDEISIRRAATALKLFFTLINVKFKAEVLFGLGIMPVGKNQQILDLATGRVA